LSKTKPPPPKPHHAKKPTKKRHEMDSILHQLGFSLKLYLLAAVISIMVMEAAVLIRRFIRLGKNTKRDDSV